MADEITDEFTREELEAQMAKALPGGEGMSVLPREPTGSMPVPLDDPDLDGADDEPLRGPQPL